MSRMYAVTFDGVTVTAAGGDADLFEIAPATNKPCTIHALYLSQSSEVGDAAEEMLRLKIIRGHTTGCDGTSVTPRPLDPNDAAAGFTAEYNGDTIASGGTTHDLHADCFNVRVGLVYVPTPECRPLVTAAETMLHVRLMAAVADDITMSGTLIVEEG